jgi:hypothetical protein
MRRSSVQSLLLLFVFPAFGIKDLVFLWRVSWHPLFRVSFARFHSKVECPFISPFLRRLTSFGRKQFCRQTFRRHFIKISFEPINCCQPQPQLNLPTSTHCINKMSVDKMSFLCQSNVFRPNSFRRNEREPFRGRWGQLRPSLNFSFFNKNKIYQVLFSVLAGMVLLLINNI